MFALLIALIIVAFLFVCVLGFAAFITYRWYDYAYHTPAHEFLKARKKGTMMAVQFHQSGAARFKASEDKEEFQKEDQLTHTAPYSTFLEPKSKLLLTCMFVSPGLSGKTMSPEFITFTNEVERRLQEDESKNRNQVIQEIEAEQNTNNEVMTEYGPVNFGHVHDYLSYSDATANYNTAQKWAAVLNKSMMSSILQTIVYIVIALAAFAAFVGVLFVFYKIFFTQPVEVNVEAAKNAAGTAANAAANATKAAAENATSMKP